MNQLFSAENLSALIALTAIEIILGIDNVVFIAILCGKLEKNLQEKARIIGLSLAMITRIILLFAITWVMLLTTPILFGFSGRDLILLGGGLFLIWKATIEIHSKIESANELHLADKKVSSFAGIIIQILMIDIIFSLDSVITAVGMSEHLPTMVTAVVISVIIMLAFSRIISNFIEKHPTFKVLALSFLILIGVLLVAEAFGKHFERGYIYFAMAFSIVVEIINMQIRAAKAR